jgi:hypothetical protein
MGLLPCQRVCEYFFRGIGVKEGDLGGPFGELQGRYPDVSMGSYPSFEEGVGFTTTLVLRARDAARLAEAEKEVQAMLVQVRAKLRAPACARSGRLFPCGLPVG